MEKPVGQLDRLIRELLDVSKIQAGRLEFRQETINLDALLHEVVETMEQMNARVAAEFLGDAQADDDSTIEMEA